MPEKNLKTLEIPVDPLVHRFIISRYGSRKITLKMKDIISLMIIEKLKRPCKAYHYRYKKVDTGNCIRVVIPSFIAKNIGSSIDSYNAIALNREIDKFIEEQMYTFVYSFLLNTNNVKHAILEFMKRFDLGEDDITYETLKKRYYRYEVENRLKKTA